jgi:prolyl-tRNA editing enzyme YbaK/EbsC (Cys-tRNA(Pro) deacylase)
MPANESQGESDYGGTLKAFVNSKGVWHRFIEFSEPVKTVEQASRQVDADKIAKSIVMVDANGEPLIAIVPAKSRVSFAKIKARLAVKDVRLASPEEVLKYSGYPAGGVPPFNDIKRALLDPQVLRNETTIVGGGDVDKLLEIKTRDIVGVLGPLIADIIRN